MQALSDTESISEDEVCCPALRMLARDYRRGGGLLGLACHGQIEQREERPAAILVNALPKAPRAFLPWLHGGITGLGCAINGAACAAWTCSACALAYGGGVQAFSCRASEGLLQALSQSFRHIKGLSPNP